MVKCCWLIVMMLLPVVGMGQGIPKQVRDDYKTLEITFVGLNIIDYGTTLYGMRHGAIEANPMLRFVSGSEGWEPYALAAVKVVTTGGYLWLNRRLYAANPRAAMVSLIVFNVFYGLVATNNFIVVIGLN